MRFWGERLSSHMVILFLFLLLQVCPLTAFAEEEVARSQKGKVTIILMDRVSLADLMGAEVPNVMTLANKGAVGLMTTNPAVGASRISPNTYATIGAGTRIQAGYIGGFAFNEGEIEPESRAIAALEYKARTGIKPEPGNVVHLGIGEIWNYNKDLKYDYVVGGLGSAMHAAGLKTAVLGNSDASHQFFRQAVTVAMDSNGLVDFGDVSGRLLLRDENTVNGKRTDYDKLFESYLKYRKLADLVVIDLGDSARLDLVSTSLLPDILAEKKLEILKRNDSFIQKVSAQMDFSKDLVILTAPGPSVQAMEEHNYLTPVIFAGKDIGKGLLVSPTTKRAGLINNTDIVPTILEFYGLPMYIPYNNQQVPLNGRSISAEAVENPTGYLQTMNRDIVETFNARYFLVKGFINIALVLVLVSAACIYLGIKAVKYIKPLLVAVTLMPPAMLLQYFIPAVTVVEIILAVVGLTLAFTGLLYLLKKFITGRNLSLYAMIGLFTAFIILVDLLAGGTLNKTSPFSYDPMSGARFYGIGNEYMGVLLGGLLIGMGSLPGTLTKARKALFGLIMGITVYIMMAPNLGTNVGGTIAAMIGFGTVMVLINNIKVSWKLTGLIVTAISVIFTAFLVFDMSRSPEFQSHIGRTMNLLVQGGFSDVLQIASRKWEVNWRLIRGTSWSWTYFSALTVLILLWHWFNTRWNRLKEENTIFFSFLKGITAASIGALLFNDSGVVAAAIMIIYGINPLLHLYIDELMHNGKDI